MKIALVIERMDPMRGGRETYTARLAEQLVKRGHDVTLMCQTANWQSEGVFIVEFDRLGLTRLDKMRRFVSGVQDSISSGVYDIVHAMLPIPGANIYHPHGGTIPGSIEAALARRTGWNKKISAFLKKFNKCRNESACLEKIIVDDPNALSVCVSQLIADQFEKYYQTKQRTRVVFNGVSTPPATGGNRKNDRQKLRDKINAAENDPVFLTVCTNFPLKGVSESIEAFAKWIEKYNPIGTPKYVVVGRQKVDEYVKLARKFGVEKNVVFIPPTRDVFQWYAACDVFVLLTWYDPCSLTVLEAGMWGIPSITTKFNGAAHAFANGGCIAIDRPTDIDQAVEVLQQMADPQKRSAHSQACKELNTKLSNQRHVDELLEVYNEAISLKKL